jgi:hypothetical protein
MIDGISPAGSGRLLPALSGRSRASDGFADSTSLKPVPPVAPVGMGKDSRGVDLESVDELDERQAASWMKQATAIPGFGGKKR